MHALAAAFRLPSVVLGHRELLSAFVRRELRARIEGSVLGRLWPVIQPAVLFAIYYLVFAQILKVGFSDDLAPHGPEHTGWRSTFYLITGILPWTVLAESLSRGSGVVLENANLIKKIAFPSELLPVYSVTVFHAYFLVGYALLLVLQAVVNGGLPWALLWLPAVLAVQFVFISGLTMFLSAATIFVRDVMQLVPVLVTFWMFTTPVFYDLAAVQEAQTHAVASLERDVAAAESQVAHAGGAPEEPLRAHLAGKRAELEEARAAVGKTGLIRDVMQWNPMASLLELHRSIFTYGRVPFDVGKLLRFGAVALAVQVLAYAFFLRCKGRFADEV